MNDEVLDETKNLPAITTKIAEYSPTAAALADLQHRFKGVVFDVTTSKGNKEAREARYELVKLRSGLEAKRKEIKAPALERSRLIDSEANRINAFIAELEIPIDEQIKREEARQAAERQAKIDAELHRVADIRDSISSIAAVAQRAAGRPSSEIEAKIRLVVAIEIGTAFAEFADEAKLVHADTLAKLREMHAAAIANEAEAARIATERAELERLRAEDAERKRQEQERADAERKAEAERLAAERRQLEEEQRAQRAEQARLDAEAAAARQLADETARAERVKADRLARESREAEERAARETRAAEEKRLQAARDEIERQRNEAAKEQEARNKAEHARRIEADRVAQEAREAEAAALSKLQTAAPQMLDALLLWRTCENAKLGRNTDGWKSACRIRDEAIAAAT